MTRYFYYQLVNIYVTVGTGGVGIWDQILLILRHPQTLVNVLGKSIPAVSLFFANLIIVKILSAVPIEMLRPWQIITILLMNGVMDKRTATRRDMRTGAYYPWPMLYGWIYPQIMMVLMIMVTYACIAPLLMPLCALFFVVAYLMYKYQLLYVYINDYQSGGDMWYAVFNRSLISLFFASLTLLGYLSVQLSETYFAGPFFFFLPLPWCILYFWHYCNLKFEKVSKNLSFAFAKELDIRNNERKEAGKPIPHDSFTPICYRQPSLTEKEVYPEPYRKDSTYSYLRKAVQGSETRGQYSKYRRRRGSVSIDVMELNDEVEEDYEVLKVYFDEVVLPLSKLSEGSQDDRGSRASSVADPEHQQQQQQQASSQLGYIINNSSIESQTENPLHNVSRRGNTHTTHTIVPQDEEIHR